MDCRSYFFRLLARRDYSAYELRKKAQEKGFDYGEIIEIIQDLQAKDYQSDERVAESMILGYQGKYGKPVICRKCLTKGISKDLFEKVWSQVGDRIQNQDDQLAALKAKAMRQYKLQDFNHLDPKTKAKLINFLRYRGFNPFAVLQQWQNE